VVFGFVCLLFVFLFLNGIAAVYHRGSSAATTPPKIGAPIVRVSSAMRRPRSLWLGQRTAA
jgi:hypothetical protein